MKLFEKYFRKLAGINFKIDKVYPSYRQGFNKALNKNETFVLQWDQRKQKVRDGSSFVMKDGKPDFKLHKKVYDVEITAESPIEVDVKWEKQSVKNFTITLSASKLWAICKATVAFGKQIPQENGRDKRDREDEYVETLPGTYVVFAVSGEGLWTEYTFKEGKMFNIVEAKQEEKTVEEEIDDSLPR